MSAFRDLLREAHAKGVKCLTFEVNLDAFFVDEQADSWSCSGESGVAFGRTGEEALRFYVAKVASE